jgi:hypothetical protein
MNPADAVRRIAVSVRERMKGKPYEPKPKFSCPLCLAIGRHEPMIPLYASKGVPICTGAWWECAECYYVWHEPDEAEGVRGEQAASL